MRSALTSLVRTPAGTRLVHHAVGAQTETARAAARSLRAESGAQWQEGDCERALDTLRRALLADAGSSDTWLLYGQRLIEATRPQVALVALRNALDLAPANLLALELFHDTSLRQGLDETAYRAVLDQLAERAPLLPAKHRDMVDVAVAAQHNALLDALAGSPDPVTRLVVALDRTERAQQQGVDARPRASATPQEEELARAVHALARGRVEAAKAEIGRAHV